jgi:hypothetical protein
MSDWMDIGPDGRSRFDIVSGRGVNVPSEKPDVVAEILAAQDIPDEYFELAGKVGLDSPAVIDVLFRRFLQREEIAVYPLDKVNAFMDWNLAREKKRLYEDRLRWVWKALRNEDCVVTLQVYNKPVPMSALQMVARCLEFDIPDKLYFEVTDYEVPKPDPFLSVSLKGGRERYVIHHWDEPYFHPDVLRNEERPAS